MDLECRILKTVKRELQNLVATVSIKNNKFNVILDDNKIKINVHIESDKTMGAVDGHKVLIKLNKKLDNHNYSGEIIKVL